MATVWWRTYCQHCNKPGNSRAATNDPDVRPKQAPHPIIGKCDVSPNGKHVSRWERD